MLDRNLWWILLLLLTAGCTRSTFEKAVEGGAFAVAASRREATPHAVENAELHNLLRVSERIYSGGEPHGDGSFAELQRLGVTTVVSVDGARPDVDGARKYGLRYVHIPIGYDAIDTNAGLALARLVREVDGPLYVHCHHGRHRGPAAAAVACIASGEADNAGARKILELAGTSESYGGLWRDVAAYRPPPPHATLPELVEVAEISSFALAMAAIDRAYDNLELCRDAGWATPGLHPDLVPAQEALLLREGVHESRRTLAADAADELHAWLGEAEETARALETSLAEENTEAASTLFENIVAACKRCHIEYRD